MMHITIGMPVHGLVDVRTMLSLLDTVACGLPITLDVHTQDADVSRARNAIAARFLRGTSDRLVFIDADMVWTPDDMRALVACDDDVVGAGYSTKSVTPRCVGVMLDGGEDRSPLVEAERLGTGFLSLSRACLERTVGTHPELAYVGGTDAGQDAGRVIHSLFGSMIHDGRYLADDWAFCRRWRDIGGRLWMHTGIKPGHVGTHVYTMGNDA
jgi:hypothetical protein